MDINFVLEILCWIFIFIILIFLAYAWDKQENNLESKGMFVPYFFFASF